MLKVVVFPAPFGPTRPKLSYLSIPKVMLFTATLFLPKKDLYFLNIDSIFKSLY